MKSFRSSTLTIFFLLAALAGVLVGNFAALPFPRLLAGVVLGLMLAVLGKRFASVLIVGLLITGLSTGWLRFQLSVHETNPSSLDFYNDQEERIELRGIVGAEPDRRADHAKYVLEVDDGNTGGRVLIKVGKLPEYFYGDELKVSGQLQTPFETEEFSYRDYLDRYGIHSVMYYPRVEKISADNGNPLFAGLFRFKQAFEGKINQVFPEPHASFMAGLLIGSRRGIPESVTEDFNTTGLTHIIAISGYNIALVIAFVTGLFGSLVHRKYQFPLAAAFVIAFTLLVGANAAVVRAAIMGLLAFYALTHGRQYHAPLALILTAFFMIFWNPKILLHDVSFQLSFAAVAGLMFVAPLFEKWAEKIPNKFAIRESLLMTMSAQVTAVPLIVFYFDRLSLISPIANVLVAPAISLAMLLGAIAVLAGWIFLPAGILIGFAAYGLLSYILWIAKTFAALPLASMEVGFFGVAFVVVYYLALLTFLLWRNFQNPAGSGLRPEPKFSEQV
ncbi:MAG: ComEC/Rec2 family competence protein [Patescibacteria group bacterium]